MGCADRPVSISNPRGAEWWQSSWSTWKQLSSRRSRYFVQLLQCISSHSGPLDPQGALPVSRFPAQTSLASPLSNIYPQPPAPTPTCALLWPRIPYNGRHLVSISVTSCVPDISMGVSSWSEEHFLLILHSVARD